MQRDRAADHFRMFAAGRIGPRLGEMDRLIERDIGDLGRDATDRIGIHAAARCDVVRRVFGCEKAFGKQLECRN